MRILLPMVILTAVIAAAGSPPLASAAQPPLNPPGRLGLNTALDRPSARGIYRVHVQPRQKPVALRRVQDWSLMIEHDGAPVEGALIRVSGGMPAHFHGFARTPIAEAAAPGGGYLIRNLELSMGGWWQLKLDIQSPVGRDQVTFNVLL